MIVHGSAVALDGRGVLILGPSGASKSALALALMAMGAGLVADDRTLLARDGAALVADAPPSLRGRIEARHVGILAAQAVGPVRLALAVDLAGPRGPRLPEAAEAEWLGVRLPLVSATAAPELAPALRQYLVGGRAA